MSLVSFVRAEDESYAAVKHAIEKSLKLMF